MPLLPDPDRLGVFVAASLALLLAPGPAVLYIVARSLDRGRVGGLVAAAGMNVGGLVHVGLAAGGLAGAVAAFPRVLTAVQLAGGAYLGWLGLRALAALRGIGDRPRAERAPAAVGLGRIFRESIAVNLTNPKALTFFVAFLPQFADPARGSLPGQLLVLGLVFIALAVLSDACWALVAGAAGARLGSRPSVVRGRHLVSGLVYLALGVAAVLAAIAR